MIATHSIDATLSRIGQDVFLQHSRLNLPCNASFLRKRLASCFVQYEFDRLQKAQTTHLADIPMVLKRGKPFAQGFASWTNAIKEPVRFEVIEDRISRGSTNGM